ncbi:hypothetical protein LWI29_002945 [Acer saccharum]|uniref:Uncharacterized protein n=1 Tax=Acer saccharum TaxID=4024 RepID=A0AA39RAP8_ACESA|nr:hypothetical protein LWI29_002945 [Acer saccharum]
MKKKELDSIERLARAEQEIKRLTEGALTFFKEGKLDVSREESSVPVTKVESKPKRKRRNKRTCELHPQKMSTNKRNGSYNHGSNWVRQVWMRKDELKVTERGGTIGLKKSGNEYVVVTSPPAEESSSNKDLIKLKCKFEKSEFG